MKLNLLLVADREEAGAIKRTLEMLEISVRRSATGSGAIKLALDWPPNLILIDSREDPTACLQLCRSLRSIQETQDLPLIVLSGPASPQQRLQILESGADDCWTEAADSREFDLRLRALARRFGNGGRCNLLRYADVELDLDRYRARRGGVAIELTPMQLRLLRHFMESPTIVFSRRQLLEQVWGNSDLDEGAVTACVVRLRRALNGVGGTNLIRNVPAAGYSLSDEPEL